jgi:hypothetical protein
VAGEDDHGRGDPAEVDARPSSSTASPRASRLPTKMLSTIQRISAAFMK